MMKRLCFERGIRRFLGGKEAAVNKTMYLACGNGLNELNRLGAALSFNRSGI